MDAFTITVKFANAPIMVARLIVTKVLTSNCLRLTKIKRAEYILSNVYATTLLYTCGLILPTLYQDHDICPWKSSSILSSTLPDFLRRDPLILRIVSFHLRNKPGKQMKTALNTSNVNKYLNIRPKQTCGSIHTVHYKVYFCSRMPAGKIGRANVAPPLPKLR